MIFSWRSFLVGLLCIALLTIGWSIWQSGEKDGHQARLRSTTDGSKTSGATALDLPDSIVVTAADRQLQKINPEADGWNSEVIGAAIGKRLGQLRKTVLADLATETLSELTTDDFECQLVSSDRIELIHQDNAIQVRRLARNGPPLETAEGDSPIRLAGNLNMGFRFVEGESLMMSMGDLAVSSGSACTSASPEPSHVLQALGLADDDVRCSLRFGIGRFNTEEEIDFAIHTIRDAVKRLRQLSSMA